MYMYVYIYIYICVFIGILYVLKFGFFGIIALIFSFVNFQNDVLHSDSLISVS